jgi:HAE1 family hydrophobic/amphiphilic exporter-1
MNLSGIFIERPIMTILVMAAILFFGAFAYKKLPVSNLPDVDYPTIQVSASYPGADPTTMANTVTGPLERKFTTIQGIQTITSTSNTGSTTIVLQFNLDKSIDLAAIDVQSSINQAQQQLPQNLPYQPYYTKVNPTASPILYLALTSSTMTQQDLYDYGYSILAQRLNIVDGVSQVQVYGEPYAVRLQLNPQKMAAVGIGFPDFAQTIQAANVYIPTGVLYGPKREFTIDCSGQIYDAKDYGPLIVKNNQGAITRVSDLGRPLNSLQNDKFYLHYLTPQSDDQTVVLGIQKQSGYNTIAVIQSIYELLPTLAKELPGSVNLITMFDQSQYILESVHDVQLTLFIAFLLVVFVVFVYLGRLINTLIPTLAIPMSIMGTFIVMMLCNYSVDILSLLALTLAIGFLVDDAIVVLENIARHVEMGKSRWEATLEGSKEICFTILSMTLCLGSVFIPMIFMGGIIGRLFSEFAMVILVSVLISGFISLSLTPMLCSRLIATHTPDHVKGRVELFSERLNEFLVSYYRRGLEVILNHKKSTLAGGVLSVLLTVYLLGILPKNFLPPDDMGFVQGFTLSQDGTSPFLMIDYQTKLSKMMQPEPAVESIISMASESVDNQGIFFLRLKPWGERPPILDLIAELRKKLSVIPGLQVFMKPMPLLNLQIGTSTAQGDYQYTLQSLDGNDLYKYAPVLIQRMQTLPGFIGVTSDLHVTEPQLQIEILRDKASVLDVSASEIENTLNWAFADTNLSPINEPANQYYVIMETLPKYYKDPGKLSQLYVRSSTGQMIPITAVTQMKESVGPLAVNHLDGLPSVTITFSLGDIPLSTALDNLQKLADEVLPASISKSVQGTGSVFQESFADLNVLLMITIFVIYVILGILYENFFHPITVMSTLPPAALGGLLSLIITGNPLSLYSFIGIILLLGIVMKNGIIMIDFANEAMSKEGKNPHDAIVHACLTRFRPILMTTVSALMGAVPLALGIGGSTAQSRRPLGYVIVGGLLFSQVLTLFLTPVIFLYLEALKRRIFKER